MQESEKKISKLIEESGNQELNDAWHDFLIGINDDVSAIKEGVDKLINEIKELFVI